MKSGKEHPELLLDQLKKFYTRSKVYRRDSKTATVYAIDEFNEKSLSHLDILRVFVVTVPPETTENTRFQICISTTRTFNCPMLVRNRENVVDGIPVDHETYFVNCRYEYDEKKPLYWYVQRNLMEVDKNCRPIS